ncbi:MAG: hypothetical protein BWZ10_02575 [candidate division BRC1 bacterium ADurb.BinA364]|nr:MAG: hypothetical protein BWZ10_02575 [candidate division BRC1 bacterium ADurb.BinA364]
MSLHNEMSERAMVQCANAKRTSHIRRWPIKLGIRFGFEIAVMEAGLISKPTANRAYRWFFVAPIQAAPDSNSHSASAARLARAPRSSALGR